MSKFPYAFLLGAATAAHQVEGNNVNSDFWAQEQMEHTTFVEPSMETCDHYHRYVEDIQLLALAGLNAYRFSIEWARIEPREGCFEEREIAHYKNVIECCKKNKVEPIVTLHHFSSPKWLISKGGWEAETTPQDFARYVRYVIARLGKDLHYVCTINEANMGMQIATVAKRYMMQMSASQTTGSGDGTVQMGLNLEKLLERRKAAEEENQKIFGVRNPATFSTPRTLRGDELVLEAHKAARSVIRELCPHIKVGLTLSLHDIQSCAGGENRAGEEWNSEFIHYLPCIAEDDFLGVQNYSRSLFGPDGLLPNPPDAELTQMKYEYYPQALENVLRKVAKDFHGELLVTENGIATADDERRIDFINEAADGVVRCIQDGLPVKGYCYWSLLDNFEWQKGYAMTFGLIAVERQNGLRRIPKKSLKFLGSLRKKQ